MTETKITRKNINKILDKLNHNFIRMDQYKREMEVLVMEAKYRGTESDAVVKICNMMLEFRETMDSIHNLFYYCKECIDQDEVHIRQLADKLKIDLMDVYYVDDEPEE